MKASLCVIRSDCVFGCMCNAADISGLVNVNHQRFFAAWHIAVFTPVFAHSPIFSHLVCTRFGVFVTASFAFGLV